MDYRLETGGTLPHSRRADASFSSTRWQHFSSLNDVVAVGVKVWRQIKRPIPYAYLGILKNNPAKFLSQSNLKRWSLNNILKRLPQQQQQQQDE